jgi:hypothetical protein
MRMGFLSFARDHRKPAHYFIILVPSRLLQKEKQGAMARDEEAGEKTGLLPASNGVDARKAYESGSIEASK